MAVKNHHWPVLEFEVITWSTSMPLQCAMGWQRGLSCSSLAPWLRSPLVKEVAAGTWLSVFQGPQLLGWRRPKCPGGHKRAARPCSPPELGVFSLFLPSFFSVPSEESWAAAACCFVSRWARTRCLQAALGRWVLSFQPWPSPTMWEEARTVVPDLLVL